MSNEPLTPTPREYVVSSAGMPIVRGTHEACVEFALRYDESCSIASALSHADVWPECALTPYAASLGFLQALAERPLTRSHADGRNTPGIRQLARA